MKALDTADGKQKTHKVPRKWFYLVKVKDSEAGDTE